MSKKRIIRVVTLFFLLVTLTTSTFSKETAPPQYCDFEPRICPAFHCLLVDYDWYLVIPNEVTLIYGLQGEAEDNKWVMFRNVDSTLPYKYLYYYCPPVIVPAVDREWWLTPMDNNTDGTLEIGQLVYVPLLIKK